MSTRQPDVHSKELVKILERRGFAYSRQSGSHAIYINEAGTRVTVPIHGTRSIGKGLLKQILKDAGIIPFSNQAWNYCKLVHGQGTSLLRYKGKRR